MARFHQVSKSTGPACLLYATCVWLSRAHPSSLVTGAGPDVWTTFRDCIRPAEAALTPHQLLQGPARTAEARFTAQRGIRPPLPLPSPMHSLVTGARPGVWHTFRDSKHRALAPARPSAACRGLFTAQGGVEPALRDHEPQVESRYWGQTRRLDHVSRLRATRRGIESVEIRTSRYEHHMGGSISWVGLNSATLSG